MSFGFAIGDFVALGRLAWGLYKQCKGASAEFAEVCNEVLSIHTALRELQDEAQNEDSILNRAGQSRQKELNNIIQNCTEVLRQLESLVGRYRSLGTSQKKVWDRVKFGDEGIQLIRNKLVLHTSTLSLFLTSLGTGSLGRIEKKLDDIAADIRAGHHEPSVITAVNDDAGSAQKEAWTFLCRELADDFSRDEIEAYKDEIKGYIKQLVEAGSLEEQVISDDPNQDATHFSTLELNSNSATPSRSPFPTTAEPPSSQWPPQSTVADDPDSDGVDHNVHTHRIISPESNPPLTTDVSPIDLDSAKRASTSTEAAYTHRKDASEKSAEIEGREANRWGNPCNVGIEIGDDWCRVAAYDVLLQKAVSLKDEYGCTDIATCVGFTPAEIFVGTAARRQMSQNIDNTFSGFTILLRDMGRSQSNTKVRYKDHECPGLRTRGAESVVFVPCRHRHYSLAELTAMLIRKCWHLAEERCKPAAIFISITSSFNLPKLRRLAEAAEIAGIETPHFVSSNATLAYSYMIQHESESYHGQISILIVDVGTRGYELSLVKVNRTELNRHIFMELDRSRRSHGSSIYQQFAVGWQTAPPQHSVKQLGVMIENARHHFVEGEKQLSTVPIPWDIEFSQFQSDIESLHIKSISSILGMSKLMKSEYLRDMQDGFQYLLQKNGPPQVCIVTGDLSFSQAVQGITRHFLSQKAPSCACLTSSSQDLGRGMILPVHGAANPSLQQLKIYDGFKHLLGLRIQAENGQEEFLKLLPKISHNHRLARPTVVVNLVPASMSQLGVLLAVHEDAFGVERSPRQLLFEAAILPRTLMASYSLEIFCQRDCSMRFELCSYDTMRQKKVEAIIYCSTAGFIDLLQGNFTWLDDDRRQNWLLKEDTGRAARSAKDSRKKPLEQEEEETDKAARSAKDSRKKPLEQEEEETDKAARSIKVGRNKQWSGRKRRPV